jgi:hypothetical protein
MPRLPPKIPTLLGDNWQCAQRGSFSVQMLWGGRRGHGTFGAVQRPPMELPMSQHRHFDARRSLTALEQDTDEVPKVSGFFFCSA